MIYVLLICYFTSLLLFCLFSHPVYYCGLLIINALICSLITYFIFGFSWYSLLFCLVYIGGVYILFVFVSVHSPNSNYNLYFNFNSSLILVLTIVLILIGSILFYNVLNVEFSAILCTVNEGVFYVVLCFTLLFSFLVLSLVMSIKINYYR